MQSHSTVNHRVKLYKLNETGGWDDKGTGMVSVGPMEFANHQSNSVGLVVVAEENNRMLMVHRILHEDIYNRQDETIITWTDPDIGTDVALSFQEGQGCNAIWQHIIRVQSDADPKHPDHRRRVIDEFDGSHQAVFDGDYPHHDVGGEMGGGGHVELPAAEMGNLEEISKVLAHVPPMQRERVAQLLLVPGYLRKLLDIFRQCEDLEDVPSMHHMFRLMRSIIMLNDTQLLDELLKEEHVMDVMGCLEYDPDLQTPQQHRNFLQTAVVFKEVVPITSQEVLSKIHQTYRLQYLKDVILPRSLDDATYATLSSLMLFNNVDVVIGLYQDPTFLPQLFAALKSRQPGDSDWDDLVAFLQEFCSLSKHLQLQQRQNLWNKMTQLGLFDVITRILQSSSAAVKLRATDILLSALAHDPLPLRSFLAAQEGHQLLDCLVGEFIGSEQSGLPEQIAELLKLLVDPETMEGAIDKNDFMEVFYTKFLDKLIAPVCSEQTADSSRAAAAAAPASSKAGAPGDASKGGGSSSSVPASTIGLIVDLLCFCVQHHMYWAKYHVLRKNVVEKVLCLLRRKERWLVVAGVRFLRTCVGTKDDFYMRHLISKNLLDPVMAVFFDNGERYNLLNSAVLELVEFIRKENIKALIEYLVEKFGHRFGEVDYVDTFKQLQLKWEQSREVAAGGGGDGAAVGGRVFSSKRRLRRDDRDMDKDEEDYFSEDTGEEEQHGAAPLPAAAAAAAPAAAAAGEPRLIIKGLYKPAAGGAAGAAAAGRGGSGGGGGGGSPAAAAAGAAAAAAADGGAGVLLRLVPYGDDDEDDDPSPEPPVKTAKVLDGSKQQTQTQQADPDSAAKEKQPPQQQQPGEAPAPAQSAPQGQQQSSPHQQQESLPPDKQQVGNGSPARQQQHPSKQQQASPGGGSPQGAPQLQQQQQQSPQPNVNSAAAPAAAAGVPSGLSSQEAGPAAGVAPAAAAAGQQLLSPDGVADAPAAAAGDAAPSLQQLTPTKRGSGDLAAATVAAAAGWEGGGPSNSKAAKRLKSAAAGAAAAGNPQQQPSAAAADATGMDVPA